MWIVFNKHSLEVIQDFTYKSDADRYIKWAVDAKIFVKENIDLEEASCKKSWKMWKVLQKQQ